MKLDSSRQTGTGVTLNGLNGNGEHEVQGVAISLGAGHGRPARMREGEHPFPSAGSKRVSYINKQVNLIKSKKISFKTTILILIVIVYGFADARAGQDIKQYYIRYDIKSSNNRIVDSTILMVPGDTDFRTESYRVWRIKGETTAVPGDSTEQSLTRARENALKQLLEEQGLKSVSTKTSVSAGKTAAMDTVISYEGGFIAPIELVEQGYDPQTQAFNAIFLIRFSPVSFPDRWKWLRFKTKMKSFFQDVISIF